MSVTNAISGLTAVGGLVLAGGGLVPTGAAHALAGAAVAASAVNIGGGFAITQRMLDMFRRKTDPPQFVKLYALPAAALVAATAAGQAAGLAGVQVRAGWWSGGWFGCFESGVFLFDPPFLFCARRGEKKKHDSFVKSRWTVPCGRLGYAHSHIHPFHPPLLPTRAQDAAYLASSGLCIAAIACLAAQRTAPLGNALGLAGVGAGLAATLGGLDVDAGTYAQLGLALSLGGGAGALLARRMAITDLPQMVAAFHSLVGFAAVASAVASHMLHAGPADGVHLVSTYAATFIGAVTLTGSAVAFGKLHGLLPSKPLNLPGKNVINVALLGGNALAGAAFFATGDPAVGLAALCATTAMAGGMGAHMTASIGGADVSAAFVGGLESFFIYFVYLFNYLFTWRMRWPLRPTPNPT